MKLERAILNLRAALANEDEDGLSEILDDLAESACDAAELIPVLEQIAKKNYFYQFDDNGAGGFPHRVGGRLSYKCDAEKAIASIRENLDFTSCSPIATSLKDFDAECVASAVEEVATGDFADSGLIPILELIARKGSASYRTKKRQLGEAAHRAIERVRSNIDAQERIAAERLAPWNALDEARRSQLFAALGKCAKDRARADRDVYASNFPDDPMVEVYRCSGDSGQLTVDYLFHWWEWCPAQSGSDWNYHCVYRGTVSFTGDTLERGGTEQLHRNYVHESDEENYDRGAVLCTVRARLCKEDSHVATMPTD